MKTVGVDIGGTFTDLMLHDSESGAVHVHKVPSTPGEPDRAMVERTVGAVLAGGTGGVGSRCRVPRHDRGDQRRARARRRPRGHDHDPRVP